VGQLEGPTGGAVPNEKNFLPSIGSGWLVVESSRSALLGPHANEAKTMYFHFGTRKIVEAAAVVLRTERCGRMSYLRLLKLLYIADRESLRETGRPIVGTRAVAMDYGPVLSEVLNLVKGQHLDEAVWAEFIRKDGYAVELQGNPGVRSLSRYEIDRLVKTAEEYRNTDDWAIVEQTHTFQEWLDNCQRGTSVTIPLEHILEAIGRAGEQEEILREAERTTVLRRLLSSAA
jgi:uncharacterized phage-associated protein